MQHTCIARYMLRPDVSLSVCLSVTSRCFIDTLSKLKCELDIRVSQKLKIRVGLLPFGTVFQTLDIADFSVFTLRHVIYSLVWPSQVIARSSHLCLQEVDSNAERQTVCLKLANLFIYLLSTRTHNTRKQKKKRYAVAR